MSLSTINNWRKAGNKIGFTCSAFDMLHPGHIDMLSQASTQCDKLIVGLLNDPTQDRPTKNTPIETLLARWVRLQAIEYVDLIIPFSTELDIITMLNIIKPDIRIVGEEYKNTKFTGSDLTIPIFFNTRDHNFSSSNYHIKLKDGNK